MKRTWVLAVLAAGCSTAGAGAKAGSDPFVFVSRSPAPAVPAAGPAAVPSAPGRAGLEIPEDLWEAARAGVGRPGARIGYDSDQMAFYIGGRKHVLPAVDNLFRDARNLPRFSGNLADRLIAAAPKPDEVVQIAYGLTDAVAGRMLPLPDLKEGWGIEGVAKDASAREAMAALVNGETGDFALLPEEVQRLCVRLCVAHREAVPWVDRAFEGVQFPQGDGTGYALATALLADERLGQRVTGNRLALRALDDADRDWLAYGSVLFLARAGQALQEYAAAEKNVVLGFRSIRLNGAGVDLLVTGPGDDEIRETACITIDLGGNDRWIGSHGASRSPGEIVCAVDLGGDDAWDPGDAPASLACGLFGVGAVFDMAGNDTYRSKESGLGCGWFGTGVLFDAAGNDVYETATHWGQGCGYAGVGALIDPAGDDRYVIGYEGQGYGATLGAGILLDVAGNDTYLARDDGNISALYLGQTVSMAQGVGHGRRADLGDGHSMAGGFGVLVDGAGDDSYRAGAWSHGAGYWWACGVLEDLGGNDTYYDGKYSLGAAAHFALGVQVDLAGDDAYNVGNATAVNQYQGHARDGSIGVSVDGDGNDRYNLRSHCGGSGDLGSIAVLYDRGGDDVYDATSLRQGEGEGWPDTPPLGTSTRYDPMRSFRDDLDTLGIFLDGGGRDEYRGGPEDWGNGRTWRCRRGPRFLGVGIDRD